MNAVSDKMASTSMLLKITLKTKFFKNGKSDQHNLFNLKMLHISSYWTSIISFAWSLQEVDVALSNERNLRLTSHFLKSTGLCYLFTFPFSARKKATSEFTLRNKVWITSRLEFCNVMWSTFNIYKNGFCIILIVDIKHVHYILHIHVPGYTCTVYIYTQ